MYHKNILQGTDKVERIVRQLAQANENLTGNVLKTILTANKVKEQNMYAWSLKFCNAKWINKIMMDGQ